MGAVDELIAATFGVRDLSRSPVVVTGSRERLAALFAALGYRRGVEVGTERGVFAEILCQANPSLRLDAVDAWTTYRGYVDHTDQSALDAAWAETVERLRPYPNAQAIKAWSVEAARQHADLSLDFVYIDANHEFTQVVADLAAWGPKVRRGGMLSGHDYRKSKNNAPYHVVQAINGYTAAHKIHPWFVLRGDVHAPSWFWVR